VEAPQKREPVPAELEPAELSPGDVVRATVAFPRGDSEVKCRIVHVKRRGDLVVIGRYETKRGSWSTMERTLKPPFRRVPS
jgi:hypothetical protein